MDLSEGSIETLMKGEELKYKPVLQLLGFKKIPGGNKQRYRLLVSDGKHSCSFAMLASQLNPKLVSGELSNFAVMRVEKHICQLAQGDKRILIILDMSVIRRGTNVRRKLGDPKRICCATPQQSENDGECVNNATQPAIIESAIDALLQKILTEGSLEDIMKNGDVRYKPIVQILGFNKIDQNEAKDTYCLHVSDGKHYYDHAVLASQLNQRLLSEELANFAVIRIEKHYRSELQGGLNILIILDVSVLRPGSLVGKRLGNPMPLPQRLYMNKEICENFKPILQILGHRKEPTEGVDRYRLIVSDGKHAHTFAILAARLNEKVLMGELDTYAVIRVDKFFCKKVQNEKMFVILGLTLLRHGSLVKRRLGNPKVLCREPLQLDPNSSIIKTESRKTLCDEAVAMLMSPISQITLSEGSMVALTSGVGIDYKPILQILGLNLDPNRSSEQYKILVSDGTHFSELVRLSKRLNSRLLSGEIDLYAVVCIEKHSCVVVEGNVWGCHISDITVLHRGSVVGQKLGNPKPVLEYLVSSNSASLPLQPETSAQNNETANYAENINLSENAVETLVDLVSTMNFLSVDGDKDTSNNLAT